MNRQNNLASLRCSKICPSTRGSSKLSVGCLREHGRQKDRRIAPPVTHCASVSPSCRQTSESKPRLKDGRPEWVNWAAINSFCAAWFPVSVTKSKSEPILIMVSPSLTNSSTKRKLVDLFLDLPEISDLCKPFRLKKFSIEGDYAFLKLADEYNNGSAHSKYVTRSKKNSLCCVISNGTNLIVEIFRG